MGEEAEARPTAAGAKTLAGANEELRGSFAQFYTLREKPSEVGRTGGGLPRSDGVAHRLRLLHGEVIGVAAEKQMQRRLRRRSDVDQRSGCLHRVTRLFWLIVSACASMASCAARYEKHLRLHEARRLLHADLDDAASAAFKVGYESACSSAANTRACLGCRRSPTRRGRARRWRRARAQGRRSCSVGMGPSAPIASMSARASPRELSPTLRSGLRLGG